MPTIEDKDGVLDCLKSRLHITQTVLRHCEGTGEGRHPNNERDERRLLEAIRFITEHASCGASELRPMSEAPTTGPVVEVLVATTDRAGCKGWLIAHYAHGGGEEQPRFRGWFFWTGHAFVEIEPGTLLGWLPLPEIKQFAK